MEGGEEEARAVPARRGTALLVLNRLTNDLENNVARFTSKELEVLLGWKGVPAFIWQHDE